MSEITPKPYINVSLACPLCGAMLYGYVRSGNSPVHCHFTPNYKEERLDSLHNNWSLYPSEQVSSCANHGKAFVVDENLKVSEYELP
jgi:hypothetical protein